MKRMVGAGLAAILLAPAATRADEFDRVRCGGDVVAAMRGQHSTDAYVVKTEARHAALKLKDLGAEDYTAFSAILWSVCGDFYMVLEMNRKASPVRDVLRLPTPSPGRPLFEGACSRDGKALDGGFVGILREEAGKPDLAADTVWRVDEKTVRFVSEPAAGLTCDRTGILGLK